MKIETISPLQWLAIDVANNYGLDKQMFKDRIEWVKQNLFALESFADTAKRPIAYGKAVNALREACQNKVSFHPVGLDASSSGIQIMSALMRCRTGCENTNLIGDSCVDAYAIATDMYNVINGSSAQFDRELIKKAVMTAYYGSVATPEKLFQTESNLQSFYETMEALAPGANRLLHMLVSAWNPDATEHEWTLPDGFEVYIPVLEPTSHEMLDPALPIPVTMIAINQVTLDHSVSLAANVVHSVDAYVLRCMVRRLNYAPELAKRVHTFLTDEQIRRHIGGTKPFTIGLGTEFKRFLSLYEASGMVDSAIFPHLTQSNVVMLSDAHLQGLYRLVQRMVSHKPFEVLTIHDDFRCHANHVSRMADEYRQILAELSDSRTVSFLLKQLGVNFRLCGGFIGHNILNSQYALS